MQVFRVCSLSVVAFVGLANVVAAAHPDPIMFLCPTPAAAVEFWTDLIGTVDRRAHMNRPVASQVAVQHRCWLESTDAPRPVAMQAGTMRIGNGGMNDGYVTPDYYLYVRFLTYGLSR